MSLSAAIPALNSNLSPQFQDLLLEPADNLRLATLCGHLDEHLRQIEHRLAVEINNRGCLLYTSPSPRDGLLSRMPSSA